MIGLVVRPATLTFWSRLRATNEAPACARFAERASSREVPNISASGFDPSMKWQGETNGEEKMVVRLLERSSHRCGSGLGEGRRVWRNGAERREVRKTLC